MMNSAHEKQKSLSVAVRLGLSFALVLAMLVLTVVSISKVNAIEGSLTTVSENNNVKQRYAINFRGSVHDRAIALRDLTLVADSELKEVVALINRLDADYQQSAKPLDAIFSTPGCPRPNANERAALARSRRSKPAPCRWWRASSPCAPAVIPMAHAGSCWPRPSRPSSTGWRRSTPSSTCRKA
jgi:methyl-accepting chemotaxis protein